MAEEGGMLVFPTAFTPSASGPSGGFYDRTSYNNDVFYPLHAGVEDYELMIFTKWGEMIFYSDDVNVDGTATSTENWLPPTSTLGKRRPR